MDEGEAGIFDGIRDGGLLGKFVLKPGNSRSVIHTDHATKALDIAIDDLDTPLSSSALCELRGHTSSLLDLGLGGARLDAQGRGKAKVPVVRLKRLVRRTGDGEVIHNSSGSQVW